MFSIRWGVAFRGGGVRMKAPPRPLRLSKESEEGSLDIAFVGAAWQRQRGLRPSGACRA